MVRMSFRAFLVVVAVVLNSGRPVLAQDAIAVPELQKLQGQYGAQLAQIEADAKARTDRLNQQYIQLLDTLAERLTRDGNAAGAEAVRDEKAGIAGGPDTPDAERAAKPAKAAAPREAERDAGAEPAPAEATLESLPEEDRQTIKCLRFSDPEPAPMDSRELLYIKGKIDVVNTSPKNTITDKMEIEMRLLCRNKDKEWAVIRCVTGFDIVEKGRHTATVRFRQHNDLLGKLNVDKMEKLQDAYTVIRYLGVVIFEEPGKSRASFPKEWWKDEDLVYNIR